MTTHKVHHDTFTLERTYHASPERVFAAWANPEAKAKWFGGPSDVWESTEREMDFRVGGQERAGGIFKNTKTTTLFAATYFDIVENRRIVYTYDMFVNGEKISVSLATIELEPTKNGGTHLTVTEQGAYFDEDAEKSAISRLDGTKVLVEKLEASLGEPVGGR